MFLFPGFIVLLLIAVRLFHSAWHFVGCPQEKSENMDRPYSHQQFCINYSHEHIGGFCFHCCCIMLFIYVSTFIWRSFKMPSEHVSCELLHISFCKQIQTLISWWLAGWWISCKKNRIKRNATIGLLYIVARFLEYIRSLRVSRKKTPKRPANRGFTTDKQ